MTSHRHLLPRTVPAPRRGFTLIEVLIAVGLFTVLTTVIIAGSISFAKTARATNTQQRLSEQARTFTERLNFEVAEQASAGAPITASADGLSLTVAQTIQGAVPRQQRIFYTFEDPDILTDPLQTKILNKRVTRSVFLDGVNVSTTQTVLSYATRVPVDPNNNPGGAKLPVFSLDPRSADSAHRPVYNVVVRIGDKANPPDAADDGVTGPRYQGMLIQTTLASPPVF